ncbi:MAG: hypothetical protein ACRD3N_02445 [Terracidiphilus sp.]
MKRLRRIRLRICLRRGQRVHFHSNRGILDRARDGKKQGGLTRRPGRFALSAPRTVTRLPNQFLRDQWIAIEGASMTIMKPEQLERQGLRIRPGTWVEFIATEASGQASG